MRKCLIFLLALFLCVPTVFGQGRTIRGKIVVAADNTSIIGASIRVKGTTVGTVTDLNGDYTINATPDATLVISYVGFLTTEILVGDKTIIDVSMEEDVQKLDEVVVVGYGTQKKKDLTSAIAIVDADALSKAPVSDITSALQGLTAGVEVQGNQGRPGELPTIRIRGVGSTNNTDPLYVVDGIPMDNAYINPSDVASMQVLKDAASSAIYGSRGANGVVIITTKSGKAGTPKVRYHGYYGWETPWKTLDLLNMDQWAVMVNEINVNGNMPVPSLATQILANGGHYDGPQTDWQKEVFQTGAIYEQNLDISGGTNNGNYFFSLNQYGQDGIMIFTPFKRYSVRMNSNWQTGRFKFGENITFIYNQSRAEATQGGRTIQEHMVKITPNVQVYNPSMLGGYSGYNNTEVGHDAGNPVGILDRAKDMRYNKRFMGNVYGEVELYKGLTFRTTFGLSSMEYQNRNFVLKTTMPPQSYGATTLSESSSWRYSWTLENMATYHHVFGNDHDLTVMAGYTAEYSKYHAFNGSGSTIQSEVNDVLGKVESGFAVGGSENEVSRASVLGRINYAFKGRYLLTANIRNDGSSKFGPGHKYGTFPSASAAWRVSDEAFMKDISWLSNLKLRASYGVVGNDAPVGAYSYVQGLSTGTNYVFNGGTRLNGVTLSSFNDPNITWETVKQTDIGVDVGLFRGTLEVSVDYFDKRTEDMLISVPLASSVGAGRFAAITRNMGSILNRGFEFSATYRKYQGDFQYSVTANLTTLHNEVLDMYDSPIMAGTVEGDQQVTRTDKGHPIGSFYGYKTLGLFQSQAEIDNYKNSKGVVIQPKAQPGDIKFADLDDSGSIDSGDRDYMGSPIPTLTYGVTFNFAYKGFDLSMFFQGVYGNKIYAEMVYWTQGMHNNFNLSTDALNRWTPTNTDTDIPRAVRNDPNGNISKASDRFIKDGTYLRLKNVTLGYSIPQKWAQTIKIESLRVYFTGRNLLTFTKYPYYDPEIGSGALGAGGSSNTSRGIDNGYYPQARTVIFGIQVGF